MYENIPHGLTMMSVVASVYKDRISVITDRNVVQEGNVLSLACLFKLIFSTPSPGPVQTFQLMNILPLYQRQIKGIVIDCTKAHRSIYF